jgi:hypothetical protein
LESALVPQLALWATDIPSASPTGQMIQLLARGSKRCDGWRKMQFQRIKEVFERLVFCVSLTRNVNFNALSHKPFILLPDACSESMFQSG